MDAVRMQFSNCLKLLKEARSGVISTPAAQSALDDLADFLKSEAINHEAELGALKDELAHIENRHSRFRTALEKARELGETQIQTDYYQAQKELDAMIPNAEAEERRAILLEAEQNFLNNRIRLEEVRQNISEYQKKLVSLDREQNMLLAREKELISSRHGRRPLETILELRSATSQMAQHMADYEAQLHNLFMT